MAQKISAPKERCYPLARQLCDPLNSAARASNDFPRVRSQLSSNSSVLALTVASTVSTLLEHVNSK